MGTATTPAPLFHRSHATTRCKRCTSPKMLGILAILLSAPLVAVITPFPASFHTQMVPTNGNSLYVRVGGKGPAVVLLHGFGDTGDMWAPWQLFWPRTMP